MKNCKSMAFVLTFILVCALVAAAGDAPPLPLKFTKADGPGATMTEPGGINNAGVTVGLYTDSGGLTHGYILNGKKLTKLDDPNAKAGATFGSNLNPDGTISVVGYYTSSKTGAAVAFLYKGGKYTDIPGPAGATQSFGSALNDTGAIVGYYGDSS